MYWVNKLFSAESTKEIDNITEEMKKKPISYDKWIQVVLLELKSSHIESKPSNSKLSYDSGSIIDGKARYVVLFKCLRTYLNLKNRNEIN